MHSAIDTDTDKNKNKNKNKDDGEIAVKRASPESRPPSATSPTANSRRREPRFLLQPSEDPTTRLDKAEPAESKLEVSQPAKPAPNRSAAAAAATALASFQQPRKPPGLLVATLMLTLAAGGFYAAWAYQPGFRALVQQQINRMLALGGMARPPARVTSPAKPVPDVAPSPVQPPATPAIGKETAAIRSGVQLPGENSAISLSSKGAEKRLAQSVPPKYPVEARSGEAERTVVLKEVVDENGKVEGVRLVEGNATLATAAIKAVKQWRYRPYVRDGKAQPFQTVVIIDFQRP